MILLGLFGLPSSSPVGKSIRMFVDPSPCSCGYLWSGKYTKKNYYWNIFFICCVLMWLNIVWLKKIFIQSDFMCDLNFFMNSGLLQMLRCLQLCFTWCIVLGYDRHHEEAELQYCNMQICYIWFDWSFSNVIRGWKQYSSDVLHKCIYLLYICMNRYIL